MKQGVPCGGIRLEAEAQMGELDQGVDHSDCTDRSIGGGTHGVCQEFAAADHQRKDGEIDACKGDDLGEGVVIPHLQNLQQHKEHDAHEEYGKEQRSDQYQRTCFFHVHSPTFLPHWLQNLEPGSKVAPQAQTGGCRDMPHSVQNLEPSGTAAPHPGQIFSVGFGSGGVMDAPQLLQNFAPCLLAAWHAGQ